MEYAWFPFLIYFVAIATPLGVFCFFNTLKLREESQGYISLRALLRKSIASYVTRNPLMTFFYHLILSSILASFFFGIIVRHLDVAVDLTYYTKASIKTYEAYDAIQSGKYDYSYYKFYKDNVPQRRLGSSYNDIVLIYATSSWKNVLTEANLVKICKAEKSMLNSLPCIGEEQSTMISVIFDANCNYLTSFQQSLYLFGLDENSIYVEDSINEDSPQSDILLSYMSVSCSLSLSDVDSAVEDSNGNVEVFYAQTDLIVDAFIASGLHDSQLSAIAVGVCLFILSISMGFNLLFGLLTILCICFALVIAAGLLPAFGFRYFSAFNVLAIFVITGVGSDAILVFTSAWRKYMAHEEEARGRLASTEPPTSCCTGCSSCGVSLSPDVLEKSYISVVTALYFTISTTVLSFMANLVSPIIIVAQLGAFMGCAMIIYFVLLHTVMIPGWLCVTILNTKFGRNRCGVCDICLKGGGPPDEDDRRASEALLVYSDSDDEVDEKEASVKRRRRESEKSVEEVRRSSSIVDSTINTVHSCGDGMRKFVGCTTVWLRTIDGERDTTIRRSTKSVESYEGVEQHCAESEDLMKAKTHRQARSLGCGALTAVCAGLALIVVGVLSVVGTDWGLPLLFDKENNISKLIYVAINYKADVLSLSSDDESNIPPVVIPAPTSAPTVRYVSSSPTTVTTNAPFVKTHRPTPSPVVPLSDDSDDDFTDYTVDICYGLGIKTNSIDSVATADFNSKSFGKYAPIGLLDDSEEFCDYLASKRQHLELTSPDEDCLYNQLMAVTLEDISIFDRVYMWMEMDKKNRYKQVGVSEASSEGSGNFGVGGLVDLTWVCQPLDCQANVSSFFDDPDHALKMIDRWEKALYKKGDDVASDMNIDTLTGSDAWLFPVLSDQLVSALYVSSLLSFGGCLALLLLSTRDLKLVLVVGMSMCFVIALSLLLHAIFFSSVINLIDIVVLISFIGIIIDYPTHMAFHYIHDIEKEKSLSGGDLTDEAHSSSFNYMRWSLIGPAMTTVLSAVPLLFADFTLVSKAGEYVVIMCICTYIYVATALPILLRLINEIQVCQSKNANIC